MEGIAVGHTVSMENLSEAYFKSHDHHRLYFQMWQAPRPRAVLIFVHGLNEHSGRYTFPINYFHRRGYKIYLFDQRGHGKSDGIRSFVENFDHYAKDLHEFVKLVAKRETKKKIFMIGHSMGGQVLINYLGQFKSDPISGFMTSSANIETALVINKIRFHLGMFLARFFPRVSLANEIDPKWISRDKEVIEAYKADPLVSQKITLRLALEIFKNQQILCDTAKLIRLPALVMHGADDKICTADGSRRFYRKLNSTDKSLKIYEDMYHEIFNEIEREQVFKDMDEWLERHL